MNQHRIRGPYQPANTVPLRQLGKTAFLNSLFSLYGDVFVIVPPKPKKKKPKVNWKKEGF